LSRQASEEAGEHPREAKHCWNKISEHCLITKASNRTQERLGLRCESKIWQSSA